MRRKKESKKGEGERERERERERTSHTKIIKIHFKTQVSQTFYICLRLMKYVIKIGND